jgi:hypothetical protein
MYMSTGSASASEETPVHDVLPPEPLLPAVPCVKGKPTHAPTLE